MVTPVEMQVLIVTAHEALGRIAADESAGEADIANLLRFCHHFQASMRDAGFAVDVDPGTTVQLSLSAKSGPAHDPSLSQSPRTGSLKPS